MKIRVIPNAKTFSLKEEDGAWVARVPAKPVGGAANKELWKQLSKKFGKKAHLTKGGKSRIKEVEFK